MKTDPQRLTVAQIVVRFLLLTLLAVAVVGVAALALDAYHLAGGAR